MLARVGRIILYEFTRYELQIIVEFFYIRIDQNLSVEKKIAFKLSALIASIISIDFEILLLLSS